MGLTRQSCGRKQSGEKKDPLSSPEDQLGRQAHDRHANRKQRSIKNTDRRFIRFACGFVPMTAIGIDTATDRLGEALIEIHHREDHRREYRPKEHTRLRRLDRTVDRVENSIAEYAVAI